MKGFPVFGVLFLTAVIWAVAWWVYGMNSQSFFFGMSVAACLLLSAILVGPIAILIEKKINKRLGGFVAIAGIGFLTRFFYANGVAAFIQSLGGH